MGARHANQGEALMTSRTQVPALAIITEPEVEASEQPAPLSPANQRLAELKRRRDAALSDENAVASEQDAAEKLIAAGASIGSEIAQRIETWAKGGGPEGGPDLPDRDALEPYRQKYAAALAAQAEVPQIRARLDRAHESYMAALAAVNDAAVQVVVEEIDAPLAELPDAECRARAVRAKVVGGFRFLERATLTKGLGPIGSPVSVEAEKLRRRIPPQDEVAVTAVQAEVAGWDGRFEQLRR
jgi:hypothetical protein